MTTKWTLGPWHVAGNHLQDIEIKDASGFIVGRVNLFAESYDDLKHLANAQLIASAPVLYEALEHALRDAESRLYMLPVGGKGISQQKDILSAQIGRYNTALRAARGEHND